MKKDIVILAVAALFAGSALLHSQAPAKTPLQTLQDMKAANATLIDQQKKTLDGLDELQKAADQLKTFSKRG